VSATNEAITTVFSTSVRIITVLLLVLTAFNLIAIFISASIIIFAGSRIVHTSKIRVTQIIGTSIIIIARNSRIITTSIRITRRAITEINEARYRIILTTIKRIARRNHTFVGGRTSMADIYMVTSSSRIAEIIGTSVIIVTADFFLYTVTGSGIAPIRGTDAVIVTVNCGRYTISSHV